MQLFYFHLRRIGTVTVRTAKTFRMRPVEHYGWACAVSTYDKFQWCERAIFGADLVWLN